MSAHADDLLGRARRATPRAPSDAYVGDRITVPGTYDTDRRARARRVRGSSRSRCRARLGSPPSRASTGSASTRSAPAPRPRPTSPTAAPAPSCRSCRRTPDAGRHRAGRAAAAPGRPTPPTAARDLRAGPRPVARTAGCAGSSTSGPPPATGPLTWLVDPAVTDAARRLVGGQPAALPRRPDRRVRRRRGESAESASPGRPRPPADEASDATDQAPDPDAPTAAAADAASSLAGPPARRRSRRARCSRCRTATSTSPRPPSTTRRSTSAAPRAQRRRARTVGAAHHARPSPPPAGYLDAAALAVAGATPPLLVTDRMFAGGRPRRWPASTDARSSPTSSAPSPRRPRPRRPARPPSRCASGSSARPRCGCSTPGQAAARRGAAARQWAPDRHDRASSTGSTSTGCDLTTVARHRDRSGRPVAADDAAPTRDAQVGARARCRQLRRRRPPWSRPARRLQNVLTDNRPWPPTSSDRGAQHGVVRRPQPCRTPLARTPTRPATGSTASCGRSGSRRPPGDAVQRQWPVRRHRSSTDSTSR